MKSNAGIILKHSIIQEGIIAESCQITHLTINSLISTIVASRTESIFTCYLPDSFRN